MPPKSTLAQAQALGLATPQPNDQIHRGDDAITENARFTADALTAAAEADQAAADAAALAASRADADDALLPSQDPAAVFSVTDEDGRRTWLEVAPDGGPTAHAADKLVGVVTEPVAAAVGMADFDSDLNRLSVAIVDEDGRRTWLEADQAGQPSARTAELLRTALGTEAPPAPLVVASGDSMTGGASGTPYPAHLADITNWQVINDGVGGENTTTIAGRMGGRPMLVSFPDGSIPAGTTAVRVNLASDDGVDTRGVWPLYQQHSGVNPVQIAGVEGTLTLVNKDDTTTRHYTFTRATAGTAVPVNYPHPLITFAMREHRTGVHVMWWGTNDTSQTGADASHIIARQRALIEHLAEPKPRYLVLGLTISDAAWRAPMNRQYLQAFGRRFVDLGAYLSSPAALQDAGITPTADDQTYMSTGRVPPSLLADPTHLNNTGNLLVARRVAARIREMGWLS